MDSLNTQDESLKSSDCRNIIEHILKYKEVKDLEERISAIEEKLNKKRLKSPLSDIKHTQAETSAIRIFKPGIDIAD